MKTKQVKAFTLVPGDTVAVGYGMKGIVREIKEVGKTALKVYYEGGGIGIYGRRNNLDKVVEEQKPVIKYNFYAIIEVEIELSDDDFQLLIDRALSHYDSTVNATAMVGGFLYGYKNRREFSKGLDKAIQANQRQLGLMIKSLEMNRTTESSLLYSKLFKILKHLQERMVEINEPIVKQIHKI